VKRFVQWVLAQRHRSVILAVVAAPLLPMVTAALMCLATVRGGVRAGLVGGAIGVGCLMLLGFAARADVTTFGLMGVVSFGTGVLLGGLVRRAGNLVLTFQTAVLVCLLGIAAVSIAWPGLGGLMSSVVTELGEVLRASGADDAQIAVLEARGGMVLLSAIVFSQLMAALLLGYWWVTLAGAERRFAAEFRRLKLGRVLGLVATALLGLGLVLDVGVVQNLLPLALLGFVFQGLAVVHAWAHAKRWHPALVAPVYILLVTPPTVVLVVLALSALGLVDNWFDLRASLRPQA
jgi:hypothetical protein